MMKVLMIIIAIKKTSVNRIMIVPATKNLRTTNLMLMKNKRENNLLREKTMRKKMIITILSRNSKI